VGLAKRLVIEDPVNAATELYGCPGSPNFL
jgi:hypothetical protein